MIDSTSWYDLSVSLQNQKQIGTHNYLYSSSGHELQADELSWHIVPPMAAGEYKLCFSNEHVTAGTKTVAFDFSVDSTEASLHRELAEHGDAAAVGHEVAKLAEKFHSMSEAQLIMRRREESARDTTESTNTRVQWFSIAELVLIVALAAAQVKAITSFVGRGVLLG